MMESIQFVYNSGSSLVEQKDIKAMAAQLKKPIAQVKQALERGYDSEFASLNLTADSQMIATVRQLIEKKRQTVKPTMIVVIGIGGSNLGTIAVHEAINGVLYNQSAPAVKICFADTVDPDYLDSLIKLVEKEFASGGNVLFNVVTKSGTTTETVVNFEIFLHILQKHRPKRYTDHIVITSDRGSKLWEYAQKHTIATLEVPKKVGGRYSVFSPVGLFPLGFVGIDIEQLCAGSLGMVNDCVNTDITKNPAALSAAVVYANYKRGFFIHDTFIFSRDMRAVGDWYRQLVGESLGKKVNRSGKVVNVGITPTVSVGTNDLHSVVQLYLGGPRDKFTTFITLNNGNELSVPRFEEFESFVAHIQGKTIVSIREAIIRGVQRAYQSDARPFVSIEMPGKSALCLGQLLQLKMIEVMYLGHLLDVNPFDQPQVELYKKETREILASE